MLLFGALAASYGYERTWRLWNIPTMSPHFADVRVILGGAASRELGLDPMTDNPGDPWRRRLNYPRAWQSLYALGIDERHTTPLGIGFVLLFLTGACPILPDASRRVVALVGAAIVAPSTLLAIERGNNDLAMFFLVSLDAVAVVRWRVLSAAALVLAFVLKLFPLFACAVFLRAGRRTCLAYLAVLATVAAVYVGLTYSGIRLIREATPRSSRLSYGVNVLWMRAMLVNPAIGSVARVGSYALAAAAFVFALAGWTRPDTSRPAPGDGRSLDAFRAGAAVYVGTFLLGENWDYRLVFLILTIPQLAAWSRGTVAGIARGSAVVLAAILLSQWYLLIVGAAQHLPYGFAASYVLDEASNWCVFVGLLYLLLWSMPAWARLPHTSGA